MSQLLKLIKQGDRYAPTVYQFGANEHLNIHYNDQYADLTDAHTGAYIRQIGWQGLRDMGYSPAKLLEGNAENQSLPSAGFVGHLADCAKYLTAGVALALTIAAIGSVTGCSNYVLSQIEQDVATSTVEPRSSYLSGEDLVEFQRQSAHANDFLAQAYGRE